MSRWGTIVVTVCFLVTSACRSTLVRTNSTPAPTVEETVSVGEVLASFTPPPTLVPATGSLTVRVTDPNGHHPSGIPIEIKGPVTRSALTDASGAVRIDAPHEGRYDIRVVPACTNAVKVLGGGFANIGYNTGEVKTKDLEVKWMHRIAPSPPAYPDPTAPWSVGRRVEVRYDVIDRCDNVRATDASFPTFGFAPSSNLKIVGTPVMRSDGEAHARVTFACTASGEARLVLRDGANEPDAVDLLNETVGYALPPSACKA